MKNKLLLIEPDSLDAAEISTEKLDEFSRDNFLLTYESRGSVTVSAVNRSHSAVLVTTNRDYANVTGYQMLDGGFFTQAGHAVLNETAAFAMFGGVNITGQSVIIDGEERLITGVIQDGDMENMNIYAPAAYNGENADTITVLMDGTYTEAYVRNAVKSIGIDDMSYDFINLAERSSVKAMLPDVALRLVLLAGILLVCWIAAKKIRANLRLVGEKLSNMYFAQMCLSSRKELLYTALCAAAGIGGLAAALILANGILELCLDLYDILYR